MAYFYLQHRKSNDLDFFTAIPEIIPSFSHNLADRLQALGFSVKQALELRSFVELQVQQADQATVVHLAQDAASRFEATREFPGYPGLQVDNLTDIASNKLLALFGRATLRDFIDIYTLLTKRHFQSEELVEKAKKKDPGFDLYWFGVALERIRTFSQESPEMLLLLEPIRFEDLRRFFNQWREQISKELAL